MGHVAVAVLALAQDMWWGLESLLHAQGWSQSSPSAITAITSLCLRLDPACKEPHSQDPAQGTNFTPLFYVIII